MSTRTDTILICDDDRVVADLYDSILEAGDHQNRIVSTDSREVMEILAAQGVSVILLDLNMPHISGLDLLKQIAAEHPGVAVMVLTSEDKVDTAVECMRVGAFDFMVKPVNPNRLLNTVNLALNMTELRREVRALSGIGGSAELANPKVFSAIVTASESMRILFAHVEAVAPSPRAVLVTGESGTGKELFARAIHDASGRSGSFVPVNVSGLDDTVFSDTLFGHRRGAFTGADSDRKGLIEQAAEGTLFLDEIGDLDNAAQVKLLRLLQENEYYPLGSDTSRRSTARIVAATNADLETNQSDGSFRKDLYYRLVSHHISIPPLRERNEDLQPLVNHFLAESAASLGREPMSAAATACRALDGYEFPGNVRELQSLVHDAVSRAQFETVSTTFLRDHFLEYVRSHGGDVAESSGASEATEGRERFSYRGSFPTLGEVEEFLIKRALEQSEGNQTVAAQLLGISQSTLSRRLASDRASDS